MTSNHLFYKSMKEDLRHKVWMIVLSLLGSFLTMPILWLLEFGDGGFQAVSMLVEGSLDYTRVLSFYQEEMMTAAGLIAFFGAVIVGLESFRFLQQKSMVDTYHSLPISRSCLFGVKYVNGLLIWLVPYLLCLMITIVLSGILLARMGYASQIPLVLQEAAKTTAVLAVSFLLVYHLMLLAVMLTGNLLNTLVVAVVLGGGVISAYGLGIGFMSFYFHSFYTEWEGLPAAMYGSPGIAAVCLETARANEGFLTPVNNYPLMVLICLAVAWILGILAWRAYAGRASELAGRGTDQRWLTGFLRFFVSTLGGMAGWVFMDILRYGDAGSNVLSVLWCIFGAVLASVLCYGVMDVIFNLDFKSFFRHKWSMVFSVAASLLICFGFIWDLAGYDRYLPEREQIRELVIYSNGYSNNNGAAVLAEQTPSTDAEQIYAFLERGIENLYGRGHKPEDAVIAEMYGDECNTETFYVRVTLKNGRSYYREYPYYVWDQEVVLPLLCGEAYAQSNYEITEELLERCYLMNLYSSDSKEWQEAVEDVQVVREIAEGYNRDLREHPQAVILGEGRRLGKISLQLKGKGAASRLELILTDQMPYTLEAIEDNGMSWLCTLPFCAEETESITLEIDGSDYQYDRIAEGMDPAECIIRSHFGVYPAAASVQEEIREEATAWTTIRAEEAEDYRITITDREEIEELLPLLFPYIRMYRNGIYTKGNVKDITITDSYGLEWEACIPEGTLPEKYIRRFLEENR
ncbi:MAG: hypothetical protein J6B43_12450 [Lachnospiraceae bacterium]|nr:hypothetical protein [Lachnospiraceae bacterium]